MASKMTFGEVLREARERKGLDLTTAARRLRIRADILRAIEDNDFSRMPPRGYTRNMVNAYARLVGLNPTEITRLYLDEAYAYQVGRARGDGRSSRRAGSSAALERSSSRAGGRAQAASSDRAPRTSPFARPLYDDRTDTGRARGQDRVHPSNHTTVPGTQYTNFYAGPASPSAVRSKLPFIIAGAIILILLIVVLVLAFGNKGGASSAEDTPKVPITGLTDTSNDAAGSEGDGEGGTAADTPKAADVAPTKATFAYKIPSGTDAYIEVYEGDSNAASVAETVSGPAEKSFDVTTTLRFICDAKSGIEATVDGEKVELTENANGMYDYTVDFSQILAQWQKDHPGASGSSSASSGSAGATAGSGSGSATGSGAGSGSSSSSGSNGSGSGQASGSSSANSTGSTGSASN